MSNQVSAADLLRCLYRLIHDEFPPIEENHLHRGESLQLPPVFKDICPVIFVASTFRKGTVLLVKYEYIEYNVPKLQRLKKYPK
jgi:hypothetical protein